MNLKNLLIIVKNINNKLKINQKKESHPKEIINKWVLSWINKMIHKINIRNNLIIWIQINNKIITTQINHKKTIIIITHQIITIKQTDYKKTFHQWFLNKY